VGELSHPEFAIAFFFPYMNSWRFVWLTSALIRRPTPNLKRIPRASAIPGNYANNETIVRARRAAPHVSNTGDSPYGYNILVIKQALARIRYEGSSSYMVFSPLKYYFSSLFFKLGGNSWTELLDYSWAMPFLLLNGWSLSQ